MALINGTNAAQVQLAFDQAISFQASLLGLFRLMNVPANDNMGTRLYGLGAAVGNNFDHRWNNDPNFQDFVSAMRVILTRRNMYNPGNDQQPPRIAVVVSNDSTPASSPNRGGKQDKDGDGKNDKADKGGGGGGRGLAV